MGFEDRGAGVFDDDGWDKERFWIGLAAEGTGSDAGISFF